jgi:hypothetical protein
MERIYRRGQLEYEGLPWLAEVWLDDTLRLGPPSRQDDTALFGPRVVLVDSLVLCAGQGESVFVFGQNLRELSAFLSVVMGLAVHVLVQGRAWTWTFTDDTLDCAVRNLGYWEQNNPQAMPARSACRDMRLREVTRPDFSLRGFDGSIAEVSLATDTADLWAAYCALTPALRQQFLQAAAKWQEALTHWAERSTLSFVLMVVACEALKPPDREFKEHNIYEVVAALLGEATAQRLGEHWFRPQEIRHAHLHRGEFHGSEFVLSAMMASYHDPTFDQARRALAPITQEAIIEWLRRRGVFTMPPIVRKKSTGRGDIAATTATSSSAADRPQRAPPAGVVGPAG